VSVQQIYDDPSIHSFPTRRSSDLGACFGKLFCAELLTRHPIEVTEISTAAGQCFATTVADRLSRLRCWFFCRHCRCFFGTGSARSEEHTSELQSRENLVCRLLLET